MLIWTHFHGYIRCYIVLIFFIIAVIEPLVKVDLTYFALDQQDINEVFGLSSSQENYSNNPLPTTKAKA